jgi:hypothetical protein
VSQFRGAVQHCHRNLQHLKVFANADAAEAWFAENDPEGVAFEYEVIGIGTPP